MVAQVAFKDRDNMLALMPIMTNSLARNNDNGENNVKSESSIEVVRYKRTLTETSAQYEISLSLLILAYL